MSDGVHAQSYYMLANGKSASDYIFEGNLKFSIGNTFKYVSRAGRKENNTAESDRLTEDTNRRNKGKFYTPTLYVDYAHKMIEKELGVHWKDNYVVWDCCCGTKT